MPPPRALVLMGVAGSGKSTVGELLATRLGWRFYDADDFHPPENIAKMARGIPLDDADRAPWLAALAALVDRELAAGRPLVLACSALKARYRAALARPEVRFVYLRGDFALIYARLCQRQGHYMKAEMLQSQFAALEEPEEALALEVSDPPEMLVSRIIAHFQLAPSSP